ncbi:aldose epimerase family protein [Streptomyces sp. NPDC020719]|uniref:aldose epimerase family protein n=1 Tax=Streptomyces sp. NPDC020719 TaxID=3154896 RepID=UPI00340E6C1D
MMELFGTLDDGTAVHRWTLERGGTRARVLTYGGILQSVEIPDRDGVLDEVTLGYDKPAGYLADPGPYYGALVGRYANRIAHGSFVLDGVRHDLARNGGPHSLHGGERGFDKRVWDAEALSPYAVRLSRVSPAGEEGFPGRLDVSVTYELDATGALRIGYEAAVSEAATVVNLTNHAYWRLGPGPHTLRVHAARYTPVDPTLIPTGELAPVAGTRFDLREGRVVDTSYDHNLVLDEEVLLDSSYDLDGALDEEATAAELYCPASGRLLTVTTSEPGLQVFTGGPRGGVALETQHFPDSPNRPEFPSTVVRPGEVYRSRTVYGFGVR